MPGKFLRYNLTVIFSTKQKHVMTRDVETFSDTYETTLNVLGFSTISLTLQSKWRKGSQWKNVKLYRHFKIKQQAALPQRNDRKTNKDGKKKKHGKQEKKQKNSNNSNENKNIVPYYLRIT